LRLHETVFVKDWVRPDVWRKPIHTHTHTHTPFVPTPTVNIPEQRTRPFLLYGQDPHMYFRQFCGSRILVIW